MPVDLVAPLRQRPPAFRVPGTLALVVIGLSVVAFLIALPMPASEEVADPSLVLTGP